MNPQRRTLIVTGVVLLLILAVISGTAFFLIRSLINRSATNNVNNTTRQIFPVQSISPSIASSSAFPTITVPTSSSTPFPSPSYRPASNPSTHPITTPNFKVYNGQGFSLQYPKNWSILTCNNSQNFEFDPTSSQDQLSIPCNFAQKSVTVIVGQNTCVGGTKITLGGIGVNRIVDPNFAPVQGGKGKQYHWCVSTTPALDITHRVGSGTAFSSQNYSIQVEQVISSLGRPVGGS